MFKNDIERTQPKLVRSKKQIEINIIVNQNKEYEERDKLEREKKKRRKTKMEKILMEANDVDECSDLKRLKKKSKSKKSSIRDEERDSKTEEKMTKKSPRESETDEDVCDGLKRKKRKKNFKADDHSGPQKISKRCKRNICKDDPSTVQDEGVCNNKKKRKINFKNAVMEEGLTKSNETSNGASDKLGETIEMPCVSEAKSVKKRKKKKKKRSHSVDITSEDEKSMKKRKRDRNTNEPEAGSDKFKVADSRKRKDKQTVDALSNNTDKKHMKKRKKHKLHTEEPERALKGETLTVEKRKGVEQIENDMEYMTKSNKKRKKLIEVEREGLEALDRERMKLDETINVCKLQNSPFTAKGKKQETAFSILEESVETKKKRKKKETSSGIHVCKVKEEQCDSDDLQIMSEKKGNLFEVTIDKARRQALQEEIDRVSGKTGTLENKASPEGKPRCTGTQWDTATFENMEQKNKFLRLMGGFKSSNLPQASNSGKHNMALNKEEEQKFNRTLQKEFDKALNLRQHRGIGLGFQPFSNQINKTFFIDKYASKSKKFDFN
ncbi:uncharacterized protein LOC144691103 isoform X2 [Cetorhinus maximus]